MHRWLHWHSSKPWTKMAGISEPRTFRAIMTTVDHLWFQISSSSSIKRAMLHGSFESFLKLWFEHVINLGMFAWFSRMLRAYHVHQWIFTRIYYIEIGGLIYFILKHLSSWFIRFVRDDISGRHVVITDRIVASSRRWWFHLYWFSHLVVIMRLDLVIAVHWLIR